MDYVLLALGLVLLICGADGLVRGAARLAASIGIPTIVIGLTVVAFGTSAPELAVSINSAIADKTELAMANVVGSNIFNVLFILGLAAVITPLAISRQLIRQDVPIMVLISALVFFLASDGMLSFMECALLVVLLVIYTVFLFVQGKKSENAKADAPDGDELAELTQGNHPAWQSLLWLVVGLALLIIGASLLVNSAVSIARTFGVSEAVIGLTILAIGTSLPEVVTSIVASFKGQRDIAVGNVVGSNTFNLLAVLGISGIVSFDGLAATAQLVQQDLPIMLGVAILTLPLVITGSTLSRSEGALFFGLYVFYTALLIGTAKGAAWVSPMQSLFWYLVLPLTVLVVLASLIRDVARRRQASQ
ncbi:calcium/sodium antiporter [Pseudidiomarina sp. 1ASP75-14]|uniref:calcium/sodium antiporter n=1 Tax=Pseudidiomarina terrestris TaxID=2820060 RepID=UPI00264BF51A|nr:calcium/sodium antiporter [Pseudidiomarina sp. 1ASP75-14]MDN7138606.1 calcium/sodium antiporter [Pseudidiomarina sp. 1ASP75-14]